MRLRAGMLPGVLVIVLGVGRGAAAQSPTLLAGGGPSGISAVQANLEAPRGLATDAAGNVYIADALANRIFELSAAGLLTPLAGTGGLRGGYGGDGGPATASLLDTPSGVAVDGAGNVVFADTNNQRVREIVAASGIITTIAGNGAVGYSGDGGAATAASLDYPQAVAVDAAGDVYIADTDNNAVREVLASTGQIVTVAGIGQAGFGGDGGPAAGAVLDEPSALAIDGAGDLFIADSGNGRIRELCAANGTIETVAGGSPYYGGDNGPALQAGLDSPDGVAVDGNGDVFIAEFTESCVREVGAANGLIWTVAGTPHQTGFGGDGGAATAALFYLPAGLAVSAAGLWIADQGNGAVRLDDVNGDIATAAGDHASFSSAPAAAGAGLGPIWGLTWSPAQPAALFYSAQSFFDALDGLLRREPETAVASEFVRSYANATLATLAGNGGRGPAGPPAAAQQASLDAPAGVSEDLTGNVFVADAGDNTIREIVAGSGDMLTVAGDGAAGNAGDGGPAVDALLNAPEGVAVDEGGNLYIADTGNNVVREVTADGIIRTVAGDSGAGFGGDGGLAIEAELNAPEDVALDGSGNLVIADTGNNAIRIVQAGTGVITTLSAGPPLSGPRAVWVDDGGDVVIADTLDGAIRIVHPDGTIATLASGLLLPVGVVVDAAGDVVATDLGVAALLSWPGLLPASSPTSTALQVAPTPASAYEALTLTATVTAAQPLAGEVIFYTDGNWLGTANPNATGQAALTISSLGSGSHVVTAAYGGDVANGRSQAAALTLTLAPAAVSVALSASPSPATVGEAVTLTAAVTSSTSGVPTGTVTFTDGSTELGQSSLDANGNCTLTTPMPATGAQSLIAAYSGDANFAAGSATMTETVNPVPVTVTLSVSAPVVAAGQTLTLSATVTSPQGQPTGTVVFSDGTATLASVALTAGAAVYATSTLASGTHELMADYGGNGWFASGESPVVTETVTSAASDLSLTANGPVSSGSTATYTLALDPVPATAVFTGTVSFSISGLPAGDTASFAPATISPLAGGSVTLTVQTETAARFPGRGPILPIGLALATLTLLLPARRRWGAVILAAALCAGCAGHAGGGASSSSSSASSAFTVTAVSGSLQHSVSLSLPAN